MKPMSPFRARTISSSPFLPRTFAICLFIPQATHSETRPTLSSPRTLFNLVPCNRELEVAFAKFVSTAEDVAAFAKNAGPQSLRVDYLASGARLAFYTPDFFVRTLDRSCFLVETKGREDKEVPAKARAAVAWCNAASSTDMQWTYLYIPQGTFERLDSNRLRDLVSLCQPALAELTHEDLTRQLGFLFAKAEDAMELRLEEFIGSKEFEKLPSRYRQNIKQAVMLFRFTENKENLSFAPAFTPLIASLEDASNALLIDRLASYVPENKTAQRDFFSPVLSGVEEKKGQYYAAELRKLHRAIVFRSPVSPLGHLKFALETGLKSNLSCTVFDVLRETLGHNEDEHLLGLLAPVYTFRNKFVAHFEIEAVSKAVAQDQLRKWVELLVALHRVHSRDVVILRYRELVDREYLDGLSAPEVRELERLRGQLDEYGEEFYRPILDEVRKLVAKRNQDQN